MLRGFEIRDDLKEMVNEDLTTNAGSSTSVSFQIEGNNASSPIICNLSAQITYTLFKKINGEDFEYITNNECIF